jgi:hypothetical protein
MSTVTMDMAHGKLLPQPSRCRDAKNENGFNIISILPSNVAGLMSVADISAYRGFPGHIPANSDLIL